MNAVLNPSESQIQRSVIRWWSFSHRGLGVTEERLLFAVPNGGKRSLITACNLKAEGVRAGVPDLFLLVARRGFHGLIIEMKKPGGRPSAEQKSFIPFLVREGYSVHTCYSFDEAVRVITAYLK